MRIQMYTTRWCGYCVRAKALLDSKGVAYDEIHLDDDPDFRRKLQELTGGYTVPQILVDGSPIGGYTELWGLDRDGRLDALLAALAEPLAARAVPRAAPRDADLVDRRAAALARLACPAVDLELVLHPALVAARLPVVAQRRSLPGDARLERLDDSAVQGLGSAEASTRAPG